MGITKGKKLVRVEYWFIPPVAHTIASQIRSQASAAREQQARMSKVISKLNSSWEGNAKNKFMALIDQIPGKIGSYASQLESNASEVERTKAMEYRWEWRDTD